MDTNGDGQCTLDEFSVILNGMEGTAIQDYSGTSLEALFSVGMCICDTDNNLSLDLPEMETEECQAHQNWQIGTTMDGIFFTMGDQNSDGFIDANEAIIALAYIAENPDLITG